MTTQIKKITVRTFLAEIERLEGDLAYGSETILWGRLLNRLRELTGRWEPQSDLWDNEMIASDEADWWYAAYALYAERGDDYDDIQSLFDDVRV